MAGVWSQRAIYNLNASTGVTYVVPSQRRQWALLFDGTFNRSGAFDKLNLRLNNDGGANYRWTFRRFAANTTDANETNNDTRHPLVQVGSNSNVQGLLRLTRGATRWLIGAQSNYVDVAGGIPGTWMLPGEWRSGADLTSIHFIADLENAANRFTGQVSIWSTDD